MTIPPLYNESVIKKELSGIEITTKQRKLANAWMDKIKNKELEKEVENYDVFKEIILIGLLGYPSDEIQYEAKFVEFSVADIQETTHVVFELKGTKTKDLFARQNYTKKEQETPFIQTASDMLRFAPPSAYGVCTNYNDFVLLDMKLGVTKCHKFTFTDIKNNMDKLKEFIAIFSYEKLVKEKSLVSLYDKSLTVEREFTEEFYKLFHETRLMLVRAFEDKENVKKNEAIYYTQLFLNRLIFIFFVEDRGYVSDSQLFTNRLYSILNSVDFTEHSKKTYCEISELFVAFDKGESKLGVFGFNGGLFSGVIPDKIFFSDLKDPSFFSDVRQHSKLMKSTKLNEKGEKIIRKFENKLNPIITNLLLMDSFDFTSEVNVNILGHIFEQSIGDLEELRQKGESRRKNEGVYYTPEYITDFICRQTIISYLSKSGATTVNNLIEEYIDNIDVLEKKFKEIKILDPACGSGAFLIKTIDVLTEIHKEIRLVKEEKGLYTIGSQFSLSKWNEESESRAIIENNIYGVDINSESVDITKLSLFLKIAEKNRKLIGLSKNIQIGNSLIDNSTIDSKSFCWEDKFPEVMRLGKFDIVVGNPPYVSNWTLSRNFRKIVEFLADKYSDIAIGHWDLYIIFIRKSLSLLKENGLFSFIVPSSFCTEKYGKKLRELIINDYDLLTLVVFGDEHVFEGVARQYCIFLIQNKKEPNNITNIVQFKNKKLTKTHEIIQKDFLKFHNCTFRTDVSMEDIQLKEKILNKSEELGKFCCVNVGVVAHSNKKSPKKFKKDDVIFEKPKEGFKKYVEGREISRHRIQWKEKYLDYINNKEYFHRSKFPELFERKKIIVRRISGENNRILSVFDDKSFYSNDNLIHLILWDEQISKLQNPKMEKIYKNQDEEMSYYLSGIIGSKLISYYFMKFLATDTLQGTFTGIYPEDLRKIPIKIASKKNKDEMIDLVKKIITLNENLSDVNQENEIEKIKESIEKTDNEIDNLIYKIYEIEEDVELI